MSGITQKRSSIRKSLTLPYLSDIPPPIKTPSSSWAAKLRQKSRLGMIKQDLEPMISHFSAPNHLSTMERKHKKSSKLNEKIPNNEEQFSLLSTESKQIASPFSDPCTLVQHSREQFGGLRKHNSRCEYCNDPGGDLECGLCNVIAHEACHNNRPNKPKWNLSSLPEPNTIDLSLCNSHNSVLPDDTWVCAYCQEYIMEEYQEKMRLLRTRDAAQLNITCTNVIHAYTLLSRASKKYIKLRRSAILIQSKVRGKLARLKFNKLQRDKIRPYNIGIGSLTGLCTNGEDFRLSNGLTCVPYIVVSVIDGKDDDNQLFCYESNPKKPGNVMNYAEDFFVPGVKGNASIAFTVLSKNGPNNFFIGQAIIRMDGTDMWQHLSSMDLRLSDLKIVPTIGNRKLMRIADISSANSSENDLNLHVTIRPFSENSSYCSYLWSKSTQQSVNIFSHTRWCVLADNVLRIYRHYGLTRSSQEIDMRRCLSVQRVDTGKLNHKEMCIAIQDFQRLWLFKCTSRAVEEKWITHLQKSMKSATTGKKFKKKKT